jgi:hypothetical protein
VATDPTTTAARLALLQKAHQLYRKAQMAWLGGPGCEADALRYEHEALAAEQEAHHG